jgi:transposase-like protein
MKKMLATLVAATVLGAGGLAVASATDSSTGSTPTTTSRPADAGRRGTVGLRMRRLAFATAAKTIGISPTDLRKGMRGGHSIADVAKAHDVAEQTVIDAIVKAIDAGIQQATKSGRITSTQATKLEQAVATRVPKLVEATPKQLRRHRTVSAAIDVAAKTIGVTPRALRQAIASGQSVAAVATAHNIAPKTVVAALVTAGEARIDKAVAQHHIDAARAANLKARLPLRAQRFVDFTRGAAKAANAAPTAA